MFRTLIGEVFFLEAIILNLTVYIRNTKQMLRKGNDAQHTITANRRNKQTHESVQNYSENNKENLSSKSLLQHIHEHDGDQKNRNRDESHYGSTMVSPTFQNNLVSLKEDVFKQNRGYVEVNLKLKDLNRKEEERGKSKNSFKVDDPLGQARKQLQEQKNKLIEHYKSKKYWSKIEKLFAQEGDVDAVLAWEDSINRYKAVKDQNAKLQEDSKHKDELIAALEQQLAQQRNETRIVSQKKCKDCEKLAQKEKEYFQLYEDHKKQLKDLKEMEEKLVSVKKQCNKMEEKYLEEKILKEQMEKKRALLKEELERKNAKLSEKEQIEKELTDQLLKLQSQQRSNSKQLHIECEQLKEFKYQAEKTLSKVDEKYKKELNQLTERYKDLLQEKNIYEQQVSKLRSELGQLKPKVLKYQFELESEKGSLTIKTNQCEQMKKKHIEIVTEEKRRNHDLQTYLKEKEQELSKAYQLIDQGENIKMKLEVEINHQRKMNQEKDEEINKYIEILREMESKLKDYQYQQGRSQDNMSLYKTKNHNCNGSSSPSIANQPSNYNRKTSIKIRQIYHEIKKLNEQSAESLQRKRFRDEESQERQSLSALQIEKYVNEIHTDISNILNKYVYVHNENMILKERMENQQEQSQTQLKQVKNQLTLKEQTLRSILTFIPEDLKDGVIDLLQLTETLASGEFHEDHEYDQYNELRENLENDGKEWRENYQRMKFKFRKMEDDIRRLEEQNQELRRKSKTKEVKKTLATDYDYRQGVSKKDIKKKYNFGL